MLKKAVEDEQAREVLVRFQQAAAWGAAACEGGIRLAAAACAWAVERVSTLKNGGVWRLGGIHQSF